MDLRDFFKRIREIEASIATASTLVVSNETADGGKAGVMTETPRYIAARLITEGRARLATPDEMAAHHAEISAAVAEAAGGCAPVVSGRARVTLSPTGPCCTRHLEPLRSFSLLGHFIRVAAQR